MAKHCMGYRSVFITKTDRFGIMKTDNERLLRTHITTTNQQSINKMSNTITNIKQAISLDLTTALRRVADAHTITDVDLLAQELLVHLGVVDRVSAPAQPKVTKPKAVKAAPAVAPAPAPKAEAEPEADGESEGTKEKKARTRTVSAKQKKDFMALEGATEENLKSIIKGYKDATQAQIDALMTTDSKENAFILYARVILKPGGCAGPPDAVVVAEKKVKAPAKAKAKKEKGRVSWNATETKIFKKIVESAGSVISDELKQEFADYVTGKTEEEFAVVALEGHMRAFVDSKKQVAATVEARGGAGHMTPSEYDAARKAEAEAEAEDDEDEDLVEFEFNEETLLKGVVSGKIFRTTTEAGDVQVGVCGQGIFKDIKV